MQLQRSDERMLQIEEITFLDFERGPYQLTGAGLLMASNHTIAAVQKPSSIKSVIIRYWYIVRERISKLDFYKPP